MFKLRELLRYFDRTEIITPYFTNSLYKLKRVGYLETPTLNWVSDTTIELSGRESYVDSYRNKSRYSTQTVRPRPGSWDPDPSSPSLSTGGYPTVVRLESFTSHTGSSVVVSLHVNLHYLRLVLLPL